MGVDHQPRLGCVCFCELFPKQTLVPQISLLRSRFVLSAVLNQLKLGGNHKLLLSQIQLSLSHCFFEQPLMSAGGFYTRSDGNE